MKSMNQFVDARQLIGATWLVSINIPMSYIAIASLSGMIETSGISH